MASSGTITGTKGCGGHVWLTFKWSQKSQDIANNKTTISWSLILNWNANINFSASKSYNISCTGMTTVKSSYTGGAKGSSGTKTIKTGTATITHASNGTGSFKASATFNIDINWSGSKVNSLSLSGSGTLNTIPRASTISSVTSSVVINGSNSLTVNISRKASFTHKVTWKLGSYTSSVSNIATSHTFVVPITWLNALSSANSLGGTVTVQTYSGSTAIGSAVSKGFTANRPSKSTFTINPTSIECNGSNGITVNISRANGAFTHTVRWDFGSYNYTANNVGTSTNYKPPQSWLNAIPNATSGTGKITVTTFYESINLGANTANYTMTVPASIKPNVSNVVLTLVNPSSISSWGIYVKNISQCKIQVTASGNLGSTIQSIWINNAQRANPYTDTALNTAGTRNYAVYVKDSRGRQSATVTKSISIVDYAIPTIKVNKLMRCNQDKTANDEGTYILVNASYTFASCNGKNAVTRQIQHKVSTATSYTDAGSFDSNVDVLLSNFPINNAYDFVLTVKDTVGKTATYNKIGAVPTATAIIDILKGGTGIAFGKMASTGSLADFGWTIKGQYLQDKNNVKIDTSQILIYIKQENL